MAIVEFHIEKLCQEHAIKKFSCSDHNYSVFLKRKALQHQNDNLGITYLALKSDDLAVIGYTTLAFGSYKDPDISRYPLSTLHIGKLGAHKDFPKSGVGKTLIIKAFKLALEISDKAGLYGVDLYADQNRGEELVAYYTNLGFTVLPDNPLHLFMRLDVIKELMEAP